MQMCFSCKRLQSKNVLDLIHTLDTLIVEECHVLILVHQKNLHTLMSHQTCKLSHLVLPSRDTSGVHGFLKPVRTHKITTAAYNVDSIVSLIYHYVRTLKCLQY